MLAGDERVISALGTTALVGVGVGGLYGAWPISFQNALAASDGSAPPALLAAAVLAFSWLAPSLLGRPWPVSSGSAAALRGVGVAFA
eukprot:158951-Prymnesium_polylepis.1